ncbi:MAG: hypothetical protein J1E35_08635 [Lachnospiraceae bacterium]|nr:hypothetical protein [Lachnospiraceae bacterium]
MAEPNYTPLLPFDSTLADNFVIYYPTAYVRDISLIPPEKIAMESGNLIKYYRCNITDPKPIGGSQSKRDKE